MDYKHINTEAKRRQLKIKRISLTLIVLLCMIVLVLSLNTLFVSKKRTESPLPQSPQPMADNNTSELANMTQASDHLLSPELPQFSTHIVTVEPGDNLAIIFQRLNLSPQTLQQVININDQSASLKTLLPGDQLHILLDNEGNLQQLRYPLSISQALVIENDGHQFRSEVETKPLEQKILFTSGNIDRSLYLSAKQAGLPEKIIQELTDIFSWQIDFAKELRRGDTFTLGYTELFDHDNKVDTGHISIAKFVNQGETYIAIRYTDYAGNIDYYTPIGESNRRAFLRYPVKYTHISSPFNLRRMHPILEEIRPHKGVDLAAPLGTPIQATGDGKIVFIGRNGGYGNMIRIEHYNQYETTYAHMLRFSGGLKVGSQVKQGDRIGYVGQSGLATGPHVHYELHINGQPVDPVSANLPEVQPLEGRDLEAFHQIAEQLLNELSQYENNQVNTP